MSFRPPEPSSADYQPAVCDATSPTLELRDAHGTLVASATPWNDPPSRVILPAGWTAVAVMAFSNWCASQPALPFTLDLGLGPSLPALRVVQSSAEAAAIPVPWCMSAPATPPPFFGYNLPFTVPGMPIVAPSPDPGDTLPVTVAISAPPPTAPGSMLEYAVTLTNVSPYDKPMNLEAFCPTYVQRLFVPGVDASLDATHSLNCGPAGTLEGGASVTFEMRLAIPPGAAAGTASIVWQLGQRGPAAKVQFQIQP